MAVFPTQLWSLSYAFGFQVVSNPGDRYNVPLDDLTEPMKRITLLAKPESRKSSVVIELSDLEACFMGMWTF